MKKIEWVGSSLEDLRECPEKIRNTIGHALRSVQAGIRSLHSKTLSGFGSAKVVEIRENDRSGTYRAVYTVATEEFVFVLHVFHKKSSTGIATSKKDIELIKSRLKEVEMFLSSRKQTLKKEKCR